MTSTGSENKHLPIRYNLGLLPQGFCLDIDAFFSGAARSLIREVAGPAFP